MDNNQEPITIKLVVVGDISVGKKCILLTYTMDKFPDYSDYVPTQFENYTTQVTVDSKNYNLSLWDTSGQQEFKRVRTMSYGQADIFLIVFSVVDSNTFDNALNKWFGELNQDELKKVPKIIVGNKIDLRNNQDPKHIKSEAARKVVEQTCPYFECSALTQEGLKPLFDLAIREAIKAKSKSQELSQELSQALSNQPKQKKKKKGCNIQ